MVRNGLDQYFEVQGNSKNFCDFTSANERLRLLRRNVKSLSRLGCQQLISGPSPRDYMQNNACDLIYDIAQGILVEPDDILTRIKGPSFEMSDKVFAETEFDVSRDF